MQGLSFACVKFIVLQNSIRKFENQLCQRLMTVDEIKRDISLNYTVLISYCINTHFHFFIFEQHCIRDLVSSVAKQNDIPLNRETLDMFVLMVLYEACSPVPSSAAKTAVQLVFGRAHLVSRGSCDYHSNFLSIVITILRPIIAAQVPMRI